MKVWLMRQFTGTFNLSVGDEPRKDFIGCWCVSPPGRMLAVNLTAETVEVLYPGHGLREGECCQIPDREFTMECEHKWTDWWLDSGTLGTAYRRSCRKCGKQQVSAKKPVE